MQPAKQTNGISICIPNWNQRDRLLRSIRSALACAKALATHGIGCEVLILDDHSRDGSQRLILRLAMMDPTGCLHAIAGNLALGPGAMRNRCLLESRYKWICFLDPGNELIPENLVQFHLTAKQTGAAWVHGNVTMKRNDSTFEINGPLDEKHLNTLSMIDAEQAIAIGGFSEDRRISEFQEFIHHLISEDRQMVFVPLLIGVCSLDELEHGTGQMINHQTINHRNIDSLPSFRPRAYHPALGFLV